MFVYACLIAFIALVGIFLLRGNSKKGKIIFISLAFVALSLVSALRKESVGTDTINYVNLYNDIAALESWPSFEWSKSVSVEYMFAILLRFLSFISKEPRFMIVFFSVFINAGFCFYIYKEAKNPLFAVLLYVLFLIYFENMNTMREAFGISLVLFAFPLLKMKKWWSLILFSIAVLFAGLFHYSVWFMLILVVISFTSISLPNIIIGFVLLIPVYIYAVPIYEFICSILNRATMVDDKFINNGEYVHSIIALAMLLFAIITIFIYADRVERIRFLKLSRFSRKFDEQSFYLYALILYFVFTLLGTKHLLFSRVCDLFAPLVIVAIPYFLDRYPPKRKIVYSSIIGATFLIYFIAIYITKPNYEMVWDYQFFFQ